MRKIDLLHNNLLSLLGNLTIDEASFEDYYNQLIDNDQNELLDISEKLLTEKNAITAAHTNNDFYSDYSNLIAHLDTFKEKFSTYPNFRKNEIYALITLSQKLTSELSSSDNLDLTEDIDTSIFEIIPLTDEINKDTFFDFDSNNITNSLLLFNIEQKENFKEFIDLTNQGTHIFFYLLSKIGRNSQPLTQKKYVLVKTEFKNKPKVVWATLCLHIISTGAIVHNSFEYNTPPSISPNCQIQLGKNYQQFSDSIDIISEYNFQKDILDKYLRIYHVLENFMYKSPLVSLERTAGGQVFSIRDFQRMYDRISDSELNMLVKLMSEILSLPFGPTQTFNQKIHASWTALIPTYFADANNINHLLKILNMKTTKGGDITYEYVTPVSLPKFMGKLIYAFRNSIVHNRETEFHLTHLTLTRHPLIGDTARIILEKLLLPTIEELVFNLIITENPIVWYDKSKLHLWDES